MHTYIHTCIYIYLLYVLSVTKNTVSISLPFLLFGRKWKRNGDGNSKETETETVKKRWTRKRSGSEMVKAW